MELYIVLFYLLVLLFYYYLNKISLKFLTIADLIVFILLVQLIIEIIFHQNIINLFLIIPLILLWIYNALNNKINIFIKNGLIKFKNLSNLKLLNKLEENNVETIANIKNYYDLNNNLVIDQKDGPVIVIFEGNVNYEALLKINKSPKWLYKALRTENIVLENVFYSLYINNNLFIVKKPN